MKSGSPFGVEPLIPKVRTPVENPTPRRCGSRWSEHQRELLASVVDYIHTKIYHRISDRKILNPFSPSIENMLSFKDIKSAIVWLTLHSLRCALTLRRSNYLQGSDNGMANSSQSVSFSSSKRKPAQPGKS